jgi:hypothetical protein
MKPGSAAEQRGTWVLQICCYPTIWKHGSFPVRLNNHDDRRAPPRALKEWFDTCGKERRLQSIACGVTSDRAKEAGTATRGRRRHGDIGGTAAASARDLCRGITPATPRCSEADGNLINQVADANDQRPVGRSSHLGLAAYVTHRRGVYRLSSETSGG